MSFSIPEKSSTTVIQSNIANCRPFKQVECQTRKLTARSVFVNRRQKNRKRAKIKNKFLLDCLYV